MIVLAAIAGWKEGEHCPSGALTSEQGMKPVLDSVHAARIEGAHGVHLDLRIGLAASDHGSEGERPLALIRAVDALCPGCLQVRVDQAAPLVIDRWFAAGLARLVLTDGALADVKVAAVARQWPGGIGIALDPPPEEAFEDSTVSHLAAARSRIAQLADMGVSMILWGDHGGGRGHGGRGHAPLTPSRPSAAWLVQSAVDLARGGRLPVMVAGALSLSAMRLLAIQARDGIEGVLIGGEAQAAGLDLRMALGLAQTG